MTGTFPFLRKKNHELRPREYLYENEVEKVLKACSLMRNSERNRTLIMVAYRHGLRASEALNLTWNDINFENRTITITRLKNGISGEHYIEGKEIWYLNKLKKLQNPKSDFEHLFITPSGNRMSVNAFQKLLEKLGKLAGIPFKIHPHMLRHGLGYIAINNGVDIRHLQRMLGHANISSTAIYAALETIRIPGLFKDQRGARA